MKITQGLQCFFPWWGKRGRIKNLDGLTNVPKTKSRQSGLLKPIDLMGGGGRGRTPRANLCLRKALKPPQSGPLQLSCPPDGEKRAHSEEKQKQRTSLLL